MVTKINPVPFSKSHMVCVEIAGSTTEFSGIRYIGKKVYLILLRSNRAIAQSSSKCALSSRPKKPNLSDRSVNLRYDLSVHYILARDTKVNDVDPAPSCYAPTNAEVGRFHISIHKKFKI